MHLTGANIILDVFCYAAVAAAAVVAENGVQNACLL